jgi:hypothetical protein
LLSKLWSINYYGGLKVVYRIMGRVFFGVKDVAKTLDLEQLNEKPSLRHFLWHVAMIVGKLI